MLKSERIQSLKEKKKALEVASNAPGFVLKSGDFYARLLGNKGSAYVWVDILKATRWPADKLPTQRLSNTKKVSYNVALQNELNAVAKELIALES